MCRAKIIMASLICKFTFSLWSHRQAVWRKKRVRKWNNKPYMWHKQYKLSIISNYVQCRIVNFVKIFHRHEKSVLSHGTCGGEKKSFMEPGIIDNAVKRSQFNTTKSNTIHPLLRHRFDVIENFIVCNIH